MILEMKIMVILTCMARISRDNRVDDELRKGMNVETRHSCRELE
jgi:hypothetical protein